MFIPLLVLFYFQAGVPEKVTKVEVDTIFQLLEKNPSDATKRVDELKLNYFDFGLFLIESGFGDARLWFSQMEKFEPGNRHFYIYGQAEAFFFQNDIEGAKKLAVLSQYLAETKGDLNLNAKCLKLLGSIYSAKGEHNLAITHFEKAKVAYQKLQLFGGSANCLYQIALCKFLLNDTQGATKMLDEYERENGKRKYKELGLAQLSFGRGLIKVREGNYEGARKNFEESLKLTSPNNATFTTIARINMGLCFAFSNKIEDAMSVARENEEIISKNKNLAYLSNFNDVIWLVSYKIRGFWDESRYTELLEWAEKNSRAGDLQMMLKIAAAHEATTKKP